MTSHATPLCLFAAAALFGAACGSDEGESPELGGDLNVASAGAQDFAYFRQLVLEGKVPAPDLLDEVGFFAEHAVTLPDADCGQDICFHPMLAVAPRFDGSNWTMGFLAMNTPVQPDELVRPPTHVVLVVERGSWLAAHRADLLLGTQALTGSLMPEDRVSVVAYGASADIEVSLVEPGDPSIAEAVGSLAASTEQSLYEGFAGAERALGDADFEGARRVVFVSSGRVSVGVSSDEVLIDYAEELAAQPTAISYVGVGNEYNAALIQQLGSIGAGTYSYAQSGADLEAILAIEGETTLYPLATDLSIRLEPAPGYRVGAIYGVHRAQRDDEGVTLELPAVFIGQRSGQDEIETTRRGGGGGLFVELFWDGTTGIGGDAPAMELSASWNASSGELTESEQAVINELSPGQNPYGMWPHFSHEPSGKAFMMLNMYLALRASTTLYHAGDCERALGVIDMMQPSIDGWQNEYDDADIDADSDLLDRLRSNVASSCPAATQPVEPPSYAGGCFFI